ncbi:MAG: hypothetical protein ABIN48_01805 [Ginsengibacter sp.]
MATPQRNTPLKRMRNFYRLVIINEDTYEEVVAFKLNRWIVYVTMSILFVVLVGMSIGLIAFTPLKYYIPGYGVAGKTKEYEVLKIRADSIEHALEIKQQYVDEIERVLKGDVFPLDTTTLDIQNSNKAPVSSKSTRRRR